jgi:histidinol-phosphate aminotransferase
MSFSPRMPDHIASLPPYTPGPPTGAVARQLGLAEEAIVKLASNENPLGMSPAARRALSRHVGEVSRYPDPDGHELKAALGRMLGVETSWLTLGSGSSEILEMAGRAFLAPGRAGAISQYCFAVYRSAIRMVGATAIATPAVEYGHDLEAMAAAITPETDLVFVANPNNPTGTCFPQSAFESFLEAVDGRAVVVLDQAYRECLPAKARFDSIGLARKHPNLVVLQTFSKAYGLAGLRVGFAVAQPQLTDALNRVRPVFNVNNLAQVAARAALDDVDFLERTRHVNDEGMAFLEDFCRGRALEYVPSRGNFILIRIGDAVSVNRQLLERGVIVRPVANYGLPEFLRVSIGLPEENRRFCEALEEAMGMAPA